MRRYRQQECQTTIWKDPSALRYLTLFCAQMIIVDWSPVSRQRLKGVVNLERENRFGAKGIGVVKWPQAAVAVCQMVKDRERKSRWLLAFSKWRPSRKRFWTTP